MTTALLLRDLVAWSLQVALLIGVGALLARLLPLRPPAVALAYWQALLLACLVLPLAQPWAEARHGTTVVPVAAIENETAAAIPSSSPTSAWPSWSSAPLVLAILAAGVALRGVWLAIGLWMLRGLRRRARVLPGPPPAVQNAQAALGVAAEFLSSHETLAPITFGLRRPAVLMPESFLGMRPEAQQAIACHELLHVQRRDWLYAVLEECVRGLLWFHPAVAWLVARVQLSREQAVDHAVVALTDSREEYVGALLEVARAKAQSRLLPATLFLKKGRLKQRVAEILKEGSMSRKRLVSHLLASGCAVLLTAAGAVKLFPLEAAAADDGPVQLLKGGENLLHRAPIEYPKRAIEKGVAGDVLLSLSLDERGLVQDARVISGPDELRAAALRSVLRWHYSASAGPASTEVLLQFRLPEKGAAVAEESEEPHPRAERVARQVEELQKALDDPAVSGERREKYEHLLREREEELQQLQARLDHIDRGVSMNYVPEQAEAELRRMHEKLAKAHAEDQERQNRQHDQHARRLALEQRADDDLRKMEYAKAAQHSLEEEARFKAELDAQRRWAGKLRAARPPLPGRLAAIHAARLAPGVLQSLLPQLGVKVGDTLDAAAFERARAAVAAVDEHIMVELGREPQDGGLILLLVGPQP